MLRIYSHWKLMVCLILLCLIAVVSINPKLDIKSIYKSFDAAFINGSQICKELNYQKIKHINDIMNIEPYSNLNYCKNASSVIRLSNDINKYIDSIILYLNYVKEDNKYNLFDYSENTLVNKFFIKNLPGNKLGYADELIKWFDYKRPILKDLCENDAILSESINSKINICIESLFRIKIMSSWYNGTSLTELIYLLKEMQLSISCISNEIVTLESSKSGYMSDFFNSYVAVLIPKSNFIGKDKFYEADVCFSENMRMHNPRASFLINDTIFSMLGWSRTVRYVKMANTIGKHILHIKTFPNEYSTDQDESLETDYSYEVIEPSISLSNATSNILYKGIENFISLSIPGIIQDQVSIECTDKASLLISNKGKLNYNIRVKENIKEDAEVSIIIKSERISETRTFKVKRIPDPVVQIASERSNELNTLAFKNLNELSLQSDEFTKLANCKLTGFKLTRVPVYGIPNREENIGPIFNANCKNLIGKCKTGDLYYFEEVKAICAGDKNDRMISPIVLTIK